MLSGPLSSAVVEAGGVGRRNGRGWQAVQLRDAIRVDNVVQGPGGAVGVMAEDD